MGTSVSTHAPGRAPIPTVVLPAGGIRSQVEGVCPSLPSEMDNDCAGIQQRDRLYPPEAQRDDSSAQGQSSRPQRAKGCPEEAWKGLAKGERPCKAPRGNVALGDYKRNESRPLSSLLSSSSSVRATAIHSREEEGPYDSDHDGSMSSFVSFSADGNEFIDGSTKNLKIPKSHTEHTGQHETAGKCAVIGGGSGHDDSKQSESQRSSPKLDAPEVRYNDVGVLRQVPFPSWVEQFVRQLLGAKTSFSFFLVQSFKSCRSGRDDFTATALFPIPWPFLEITETGPVRPSQRSRLLKAQKKLVHCAVMAMNYEYFRAPFAVLPLLRRQPSALHLQVYHRLMAFVRACGPSCNVSIAGCGRKSFQLDARFNELLKGLEGLGLEAKSKYHSGFEAEEVPLDDSRYEELKPYREL